MTGNQNFVIFEKIVNSFGRSEDEKKMISTKCMIISCPTFTKKNLELYLTKASAVGYASLEAA